MMKSGIVVHSTHYEVEDPFFRQWICQNITQYFWNSKKKEEGGVNSWCVRWWTGFPLTESAISYFIFGVFRK